MLLGVLRSVGGVATRQHGQVARPRHDACRVRVLHQVARLERVVVRGERRDAALPQAVHFAAQHRQRQVAGQQAHGVLAALLVFGRHEVREPRQHRLEQLHDRVAPGRHCKQGPQQHQQVTRQRELAVRSRHRGHEVRPHAAQEVDEVVQQRALWLALRVAELRHQVARWQVEGHAVRGSHGQPLAAQLHRLRDGVDAQAREHQAEHAGHDAAVGLRRGAQERQERRHGARHRHHARHDVGPKLAAAVAQRVQQVEQLQRELRVVHVIHNLLHVVLLVCVLLRGITLGSIGHDIAGAIDCRHNRFVGGAVVVLGVRLLDIALGLFLATRACLRGSTSGGILALLVAVGVRGGDVCQPLQLALLIARPAGGGGRAEARVRLGKLLEQHTHELLQQLLRGVEVQGRRHALQQRARRHSTTTTPRCGTSGRLGVTSIAARALHCKGGDQLERVPHSVVEGAGQALAQPVAPRRREVAEHDEDGGVVELAVVASAVLPQQRVQGRDALAEARVHAAFVDTSHDPQTEVITAVVVVLVVAAARGTTLRGRSAITAPRRSPSRRPGSSGCVRTLRLAIAAGSSSVRGGVTVGCRSLGRLLALHSSRSIPLLLLLLRGRSRIALLLQQLGLTPCVGCCLLQATYKRRQQLVEGGAHTLLQHDAAAAQVVQRVCQRGRRVGRGLLLLLACHVGLPQRRHQPSHRVLAAVAERRRLVQHAQRREAQRAGHGALPARHDVLAQALDHQRVAQEGHDALREGHGGSQRRARRALVAVLAGQRGVVAGVRPAAHHGLQLPRCLAELRRRLAHELGLGRRQGHGSGQRGRHRRGAQRQQELGAGAD